MTIVYEPRAERPVVGSWNFVRTARLINRDDAGEVRAEWGVPVNLELPAALPKGLDGTLSFQNTETVERDPTRTRNSASVRPSIRRFKSRTKQLPLNYWIGRVPADLNQAWPLVVLASCS